MGAEKSSFALTCTLLSQYIKEKKGGLADLGIGLNRAPLPKVETPRTMNLLPGLGLPNGGDDGTAAGSPGAAQMTIFYGGRVMVFDNFPADKANEIFAMVGRGSPAPASSLAAAASSPAGAPPPQKPALVASDLPIARRASLNRFLEKRKERIISRTPYAIPASPMTTSSSHEPTKAETKVPWLGLAPAKLDNTL